MEFFADLEVKDRIIYGTFDKISEKVINKDGNLRDMTL